MADATMLPVVKSKHPGQQNHVCDTETRLSGNPAILQIHKSYYKILQNSHFYWNKLLKVQKSFYDVEYWKR